jgi:hypothetical protein
VAKFPGERGGFLAVPKQFSQVLDQVLTGRSAGRLPDAAPMLYTLCDQLSS